MKYIKAGTTDATKKQMKFPILRDATDGFTPETGEAGGQPQISINGGAWTSTGIGVLVSVGNGSYYAVLSDSTVAVAGREIEGRYKSSNTAEERGRPVTTTVYDPQNETQTASLGTSAIGASQIADGALTAPKFGANVVNSTTVANDAFTAAKFVDGFLTAAKIGAGALTSAKFAAAALIETVFGSNALTAAKFAADVNTYSLNGRVVQVDASTQKYVVWFTKNGGAAVGFGSITGTPTIVVTDTDDDELVPSSELTSWGTTGSYYFTATGDARLDAGKSAEFVVSATIDGVSVQRKVVVEKNNNA